jgi:WhiB family redox-sensing transcriptional regulator
MGVTDFFTIPHNNSKAIAQVIENTLAVCKGCPVRIPCLRFAVENEITHGIWGGMTAIQRKRNSEEVSVMLSAQRS